MHAQFRLSGPVGAQTRIRREDTLRTKRALSRLGFLKASDDIASSIASTAMIEGLKAFQRENGLGVDGTMTPDGPTERLIRVSLMEAGGRRNAAGSSKFQVSAPVGDGMENRASDVIASKRALMHAGFISKSDLNTDLAERTLSGAIEGFQRAFNLDRSGKISPGSKTEQILARFNRLDDHGGKPNSKIFDFPDSELRESKRSALRKLTVETSPADGNPTFLGRKKVKSNIDKVEEKFWQIAQFGRREGNVLAAEMLERFLFADGGTEFLPVKRIRAFPDVRKAESVNIGRFERDWLKRDSLAYKTIINLKDGEESIIEVKDPKHVRRGDPIFDRLIQADSSTPQDGELHPASGDSTLSSTGKFRVKRSGNTVTIEGVVNHLWKDRYDWEGGNLRYTYIPGFWFVPDEEGRLLTRHGRAKPFLMRSNWRQNLTGTVQLRPALRDKSKLVPFRPNLKWDIVEQ